MSAPATPLEALRTPAEHRRRSPPHDHLCTCGRLREECVRDAVRALWT